MSTLFKFIILCFLFGKFVFADEIIQDKNGNYFLMKDDGTFIKLPKPKAGNKYIIKKKQFIKRKNLSLRNQKKKQEEEPILDLDNE